jgi:hypothetical protein
MALTPGRWARAPQGRVEVCDVLVGRGASLDSLNDSGLGSRARA